MGAKVFNCNTVFSGMTMTHAFDDGSKVVTDLQTMTVSYIKNDQLIDKVDCTGMTISDYGNYLKRVLDSVEINKKFQSDGD